MAVSCEILVLSPHLDDEVLGCFTFLGPSTHVLYFGVEDRPYASRSLRVEEMQAVASSLGFTWELLNHTVNSYHAPALIGEIENTINRFRPYVVLIPEPSYNQDHRAVYDAALVATRPHDTNWRVPTVLLFEQPDSILWRHSVINEPALFQELDVQLKLQAYATYASQVRGHRSPDTVRAQAELRGAQIGRPYAEAFVVRRMITRMNEGTLRLDYVNAF